MDIYDFNINGMKDLINEEGLEFDDNELQNVLRTVKEYYRDDILDPLDNEDEDVVRFSKDDDSEVM